MEPDLPEKNICLELGLDKETLKKYREVAINAGDYVYQKESKRPKSMWAWHWKPEGVKWLRTELYNKDVKINNNKIDDVNPSEKTGIVFKHDFPNARMVMIKLDDGEKVVATCNDNSLFRKGMQVTIKLDRHGWYLKRNPHTKNNG
jgi:hypothetical protein